MTDNKTRNRFSWFRRHKVWTAIFVLVLLGLAAWGIKTWYSNYQATKYQDSLDSFYTTPNPLPPGKPGQIIRSEPLGTNPPNGTGYRVMYYTQLPNGTLAVSSGMIFVPSAPAPAEGRKIVAWAHGTVGLGDNCAPSRQQNPTSAISTWIGDMMSRNYVVTATDYTGLGTAGEPYYLVGESEARDVLNSVRAAQGLLSSSASNNYALFGHSQGGHAVLWATQLAGSYAPELRLVATAAGAPAAELPALLQEQYSTGAAWAIGPIVSASWPNYYSGLSNQEVVSSAGLRNYQRLAYRCLVDETANILIRSAIKQPYYKSDPVREPDWYNAANNQVPQAPPPSVPTLIAQGLTDNVVLPNTTALLIQQYCNKNSNISTMWLGQTGHLQLALIAGPTIAEWLQARFEGQPTQSTCTQPLPLNPASIPATP
ncbi:hypothetical protein HYX70_00410 [Candidatus Saccharibacteria bacterium]|nr:hypothetical protein [Candidatus Saccharibacteria bacterium]